MSEQGVQTGAVALSRFVGALRFEEIPNAVVESAKLRVLDILGICVAASHPHGGAKVVGELAKAWGGRKEAHCIGSSLRVPAVSAGLVNGTRAHSLDFDDTHHASRVHPSCVVVPTALAAAQREEATGKEFLTSTVAGLEVLVRVGLVAPGRFHERGLHATSLCGVIGSAATASRLLGLNFPQTTNALGISASMASGLRESYLGEQATDTKALHAGWAAHGGILSAELAHEGFTGPATALEGRFGFFHAFVAPDEWDEEVLRHGLGEDWHIPEIVFKLFPCGSLIHASIEAALILRNRHKIKPSDIEEIVVVVPPGMVSTVCEPLEQKLRPSTGYQAKFSAQFAVAAALRFGHVTEESFSPQAMTDPSLQELLARTRYRTDPSMPFPEKYPGGLVVRTRNGKRFRQMVSNSPGSIERPATEEDIRKKFIRNVEGRIDRRAAEELSDRVMRLEDESGVNGLLELCVGPGG